MNNTKYATDPGLPDETAFPFPKDWLNQYGGWPSANGKQAERWEDFLDEEDKGKPYYACLIKDGVYFEIFVNSQEELTEYMKYHQIEVDTESPYVWNDGQVHEVFK